MMIVNIMVIAEKYLKATWLHIADLNPGDQYIIGLVKYKRTQIHVLLVTKLYKAMIIINLQYYL